MLIAALCDVVGLETSGFCLLSRVSFELRFVVVIGAVVVMASAVLGFGLWFGYGSIMVAVGETNCSADSSMISSNGFSTQNVVYRDNANMNF